MVLDLFNPTQDSLTAQINASALKSRIEDGLTLNFLLRRCALLTTDEYGDTYRALETYAARMQPQLSAAQVETLLHALHTMRSNMTFNTETNEAANG